MAKKKPSATANSAGTATTARAKGSAATSPGVLGRKREVTARRSPDLCNDLIGQTAGLVWQTLADNGAQTLATLKKSVDAPSDLVLLAVGWLAREDKLDFETAGRTTTISLR